jgi:hypothetical protein
MWLQLANVRFSPPAAISCHEAMGQDGSTRVPASGSAQSLDRCGRLQSAPMRYLTATGSGVVTAIGTAILWRIVRFVLPLAVPPFLSRIGATQSWQRKRRRGNRVRYPQNRAAMSGVPPAPCASESTVAPAEIHSLRELREIRVRRLVQWRPPAIVSVVAVRTSREQRLDPPAPDVG